MSLREISTLEIYQPHSIRSCCWLYIIKESVVLKPYAIWYPQQIRLNDFIISFKMVHF